MWLFSWTLPGHLDCLVPPPAHSADPQWCSEDREQQSPAQASLSAAPKAGLASCSVQPLAGSCEPALHPMRPWWREGEGKSMGVTNVTRNHTKFILSILVLVQNAIFAV